MEKRKLVLTIIGVVILAMVIMGYIYFSKPGRDEKKNQQTINQVQTVQQKTDEKKENTEKNTSGDELENVTPGSDEYYGSEPFKEAYQQIHELYKEQGLSESKIDKLVVLDVKDKDYFVLTTNVDHQFQKAGFDKQRLFYTQGDYGLFQCSEPCHRTTYDNDGDIGEVICRCH